MVEKFHTSLRRGGVLLLAHTPTVANQIIQIHQTVIMLQEIDTFLVSTLKPKVHLIHSLLYKQKLIQSQLFVSIMKQFIKNTSEQISSHQNSAELIDHTCDDNGYNVLNSEKEADVTSIHSINATSEISMNDDDNFIHNIIPCFYHQIIMQMYLLDQNMIQQTKSSLS